MRAVASGCRANGWCAAHIHLGPHREELGHQRARATATTIIAVAATSVIGVGALQGRCDRNNEVASCPDPFSRRPAASPASAEASEQRALGAHNNTAKATTELWQVNTEPRCCRPPWLAGQRRQLEGLEAGVSVADGANVQRVGGGGVRRL